MEAFKTGYYFNNIITAWDLASKAVSAAYRKAKSEKRKEMKSVNEKYEAEFNSPIQAIPFLV